MSGFLKLLSGVKLYVSYYFAIISVLGIIWGAFRMYDNWKDNNEVLQTNVNSIVESQETQRKNDSLLLERQMEMGMRLQTIQETTESLENSYVRYLTRDKTLTKEDFMDYMEGLSFDLKKNSLGGQLETTPPMLIQEELTMTK